MGTKGKCKHGRFIGECQICQTKKAGWTIGRDEHDKQHGRKKRKRGRRKGAVRVRKQA